MATRAQLALNIIYGSTTSSSKRPLFLDVDFWDGVLHLANLTADILMTTTQYGHTAHNIHKAVASARKTILKKEDVQYWVEYKLQMVVAKLQSIDKANTPVDYAYYNGQVDLLHELLHPGTGAGAANERQ